MQATNNVVAGSTRPYTGPLNLVKGFGVIQGGTDGAFIAPTAAGQQCLGIIENSDLVGDGFYSLVRSGEAYAICGAAVAAGQYVKMDALGRFVPTTAAGDYIYGRALSSTVNPGDEFVLFICEFIR